LKKKKLRKTGVFIGKMKSGLGSRANSAPISAPSRLISTEIRYDANPLRRTDERVPAETIEMEYFQRTNVVFKK
jgi:hypothetical protein